MTFSNGGGTLTLPSPTHAHADSQLAALRRTFSRSPSKFNVVRTQSAASQRSFCSQSSESSFGGRQTPQSPCPRGVNLFARSSLANSQSAGASSSTSLTTESAPTPSFRSRPVTSQQQATSHAPASSAPPATARAASIFSTPQPHLQSSSRRPIFSQSQPTPESSQQMQQQETPFARTPFAPAPPRSGFRLSLRASRLNRTPSTRTGLRSRVPKSPKRSVLGLSSDSGNSSTTPTSAPPLHLALGQENTTPATPSQGPTSPLRARNLSRTDRHSMHLDISGLNNQAFSKLMEPGSTTPEGFPPSAVSPLKRSDAMMDLGQANFNSPVAKRRSVHGGFSAVSGPGSAPASGSDHNSSFGYFDQHCGSASTAATPAGEMASDDGNNQEYQLAGTSNLFSDSRPASPAPHSQLPRRNSLRKSTGRFHPSSFRARLPPQQLFGNSNAAAAADLFTPNIKTASSRADSLFAGKDSSVKSLQGSSPTLERMAQPHPLSRALTNSSAEFASAMESPRQFAVPAKPASYASPKKSLFAKSMPIGARPPMFAEAVETPQVNFKGRRPGPPATTALVSKMITLPYEESLDAAGKMAMPDTPCKKPSHPSYHFATYPPPSGSSHKKKMTRPTFPAGGFTSTPFNPISKQSSTFGLGGPSRGGNLFNKLRNGHERVVSSFSSIDDSDRKMGDEFGPDDLPPTPTKVAGPTKQSLFSTPRAAETPSHLRFGAPTSAVGNGLGRHSPLSGNSSPLDRLEFQVSTTPRTPHDVNSPDPSGFSISHFGDAVRSSLRAPATPTTRQDSTPIKRVMTPVNSIAIIDVDESLINMFDKVSEVGSGEFSKVYRVAMFSRAGTPSYDPSSTPVKRSFESPGPQVFAVKKLKLFIGQRDRENKLREVEILRSLCHENVLGYKQHWEERGHLYIKTEFCASGSLSQYLEKVGKMGRLDDFRIWKMILEIGAGIQHIHDSGFIHLDLKPANVFVTSDGVLKIGDFGLAAACPVVGSIDGEGDREYIAPEILQGKYDRPADIFAFGLMILEIAANVRLPGNGETWVNLRNGIMKDVPILTWDPQSSVPIVTSPASEPPAQVKGTPYPSNGRRRLFETKRIVDTTSKVDGRLDPPPFMEDHQHASSLDRLVQWMLTPNPEERPSMSEVLMVEGCLWVDAHRHRGAMWFEGQWGPKTPSRPVANHTPTLPQTPRLSEAPSDVDTVMTDV